MAQINTNYNYPVPPENVYGQTIAGPSVETNNTQQANKTEQTTTTTAQEETKGRYVNTYA